MATKIGTLQNPQKTEALLPRTCLKAIADKNGDYLDEDLTASDINALKGGALTSLTNNFNELVIINNSYTVGNVTITSSGYSSDISIPSIEGYTVVFVGISNWVSASPAVGFSISGTGVYVIGTGGQTISNLRLRIVYMKTAFVKLL